MTTRPRQRILQGQFVSARAAAESYVGEQYEIDDGGGTYSAHPGDYFDGQYDRVIGDLYRKRHPYVTTSGRIIIAPRLLKQFAKVSDIRRLARAAESLVAPARDEPLRWTPNR